MDITKMGIKKGINMKGRQERKVQHLTEKDLEIVMEYLCGSLYELSAGTVALISCRLVVAENSFNHSGEFFTACRYESTLKISYHLLINSEKLSGKIVHMFKK